MAPQRASPSLPLVLAPCSGTAIAAQPRETVGAPFGKVQLAHSGGQAGLQPRVLRTVEWLEHFFQMSPASRVSIPVYLNRQEAKP